VLSKTLALAVIAICVIGLAWWWLDPAGFAQNPVFRYLNGLSTRSSEHFK
jgi:hypothetical protein